MNNEGRWIYKEEKRKTFQTLDVIPGLHFYDSKAQLQDGMENLETPSISNPNVEDPLNRFNFATLTPDPTQVQSSTKKKLKALKS